jgi:hypothetical protein
MIDVHKISSRERCKDLGVILKKVKAQAFARAFPHQGRQI